MSEIIEGVAISDELMGMVESPSYFARFSPKIAQQIHFTGRYRKAVLLSCELRLRGFSAATANAIAVSLVYRSISDMFEDDGEFAFKRYEVNWLASIIARDLFELLERKAL